MMLCMLCIVVLFAVGGARRLMQCIMLALRLGSVGVSGPRGWWLLSRG